MGVGLDSRVESYGDKIAGALMGKRKSVEPMAARVQPDNVRSEMAAGIPTVCLVTGCLVSPGIQAHEEYDSCTNASGICISNMWSAFCLY
jgi:hypothetical protein